MLPARSATRSPLPTPNPARAPAVRSTRWSSSEKAMERPWKTRASFAGKSSAASRTRSARFTASEDLHVLTGHRAGRGSTGPFGVRGSSRLEEGELLEPAGPPFEQHQPARAHLGVVAEP